MPPRDPWQLPDADTPPAPLERAPAVHSRTWHDQDGDLTATVRRGPCDGAPLLPARSTLAPAVAEIRGVKASRRAAARPCGVGPVFRTRGPNPAVPKSSTCSATTTLARAVPCPAATTTGSATSKCARGQTRTPKTASDSCTADASRRRQRTDRRGPSPLHRTRATPPCPAACGLGSTVRTRQAKVGSKIIFGKTLVNKCGTGRGRPWSAHGGFPPGPSRARDLFRGLDCERASAGWPREAAYGPSPTPAVFR